MKNENKKAIGIILAATILISVFVAIALAVSANESGIASIDTTVKVPETSRLAGYNIAVVNAGYDPGQVELQLEAWGATVDLINVPDITESLLSMNYDLVWIGYLAAGAVDTGGKAPEILSYVRKGGGEILAQPGEVMTPQCLPYTWQIVDARWVEPPCAATIVAPTHKLTAGLTLDDMPDCFDDVGTVAPEYTILAQSGAGDASFGCANYGKGRVIVEMDCPLGPSIGDVCGDSPSLSEAMVTRMVEWVSQGVPCYAETAVYTTRVHNPGGILNPLRELRDDYLKEEYVDRYYDYSPELTMVITRDPALAYEAARLLVKYSPMVEQQVTGTGKVKLITRSDVEEVLSFTDRLKSGVRKNSGEIGYMRSQGIIKFLDEFKEQVEASEGKTFSEALQDSIYCEDEQMPDGEVDTTTGDHAKSGDFRSLEPKVETSQGGRVLWDLTHGVHISYQPSGYYSTLVSVLSRKGYTIETTDAGILNIDLNEYDVLVICLGSAWDSAYTTGEVTAITNFVENGGGLLIMGDNTGCPNSNINPVSQAFGTTCGIGEIADTISNLALHPIFEGVNQFETACAAEIDGVFPSEEVAWDVSDRAAVTAATYRCGKVVTTGDINLWDNSYISNADNQLFAENTFDWLTACVIETAAYGAPLHRDTRDASILNPLRELRDDYLKEEYVDRYYDYSPELTMVITRDPALAYEAARLLVKYSPMVEQQVTGTGKVKLITRSDVEEVLSFTDRLKSGVRKNSGEIGYMRSQGIIKFLDEFKEQVEASEGKTFSEALQDSIYYMGNIDTTPDENNESGIASIDTTVKVPEASSSSGITRP